MFGNMSLGFLKEKYIDMNTAYCYGHKMAVITYQRSFVKFDKMGEVDYDQEPFYIANEGIYMFGGVTGE